nr:asparagine synthase (glutamine-hydrolyzing) [uncultured Desulfobulbus sp.]
MCGIAGIYRHNGLTETDQKALNAMTAALAHRGPDEETYFRAPQVGLGCRRLSIVDIAHGHQPMYSNDETMVSVANAEIYNHQELRQELIKRGVCFQTSCDVEVIPHLFRTEGPDCIGRLNGQFAFAVYDTKRKALFLGRDQTGIAPLFWSKIHGGILFASEIKALMPHPETPRRLDPAGLDQVITFPGLISPQTMFKGIHALPPGHWLRIEGEQIEVQQYWDFDFPQAADMEESTEEKLLEELEAALTTAVSRRLRADVPVGFYVSGGLDSALIATLAHKVDSATIRDTFSIGFNIPEIDERPWQSQITQAIGSRHHEAIFDQDRILAHLQDIVWHGETVLKESYNACTMLLAQLVHKNDMRVTLTGEGADELFAGYVGYRFDETRTGNGLEELDDLEAMLEEETRERLWGDASFFYERNYNNHAELTLALLSPELAANRAAFSALARSPLNHDQLTGRSLAHKRSYIDCKLRLADHLLADHSDRVAYAAQVEARYPFLDPDVIAVARRIPQHIMVKDGEEKYLLKKLGAKLLPQELVQRRKFSFVAHGSPHLLRQGQDWVMDLLSPERIRQRGIFNPDTVASLTARALRPDCSVNQTYEDDYLMIVLTTELLMDAFSLSSPT